MVRMLEAKAVNEAILDVMAPDAQTRSVRITQSPFLIGRGGGAGNQLQLSDGRISRSAAAIFFDDGYYLEDRGQRGGLFLNGKKITKHALQDGDIITFGPDGSHQIIFRTADSAANVDQLLSRIENITHSDSSSGGLSKINLLLEATMLLHSQLPLDAVLGPMLNHAIAVTDAERGLLLERAGDHRPGVGAEFLQDAPGLGDQGVERDRHRHGLQRDRRRGAVRRRRL